MAGRREESARYPMVAEPIDKEARDVIHDAWWYEGTPRSSGVVVIQLYSGLTVQLALRRRRRRRAKP